MLVAAGATGTQAAPVASSSPTEDRFATPRAAKYLPAAYAAPNDWCKGRNIRRAVAYAPKRTFTTYETKGDARGPHKWTASITVYGWDCVDGRSRVHYDFHWDMTHIQGTTISYQVAVKRRRDTRATKIYDLKPKTFWRCCSELSSLPGLTFGRRDSSRLKNITVKPLFNKEPTAASFGDTKRGLKARFEYLPYPR